MQEISGISVVIPSFNRPQLTSRAVKSALAQTWTSFEVLVIDDGSRSDQIFPIELIDDDRVRLIRHRTNLGVSAARNTGVNESRYIQYLPNMVVFHPNPILYNRNHLSKAFHYGVGMGRVLSKHRYKLYFNLYSIFRPIAGAVRSLLTLRPRKAVYHLAIAGGRACGLWS